MKKLKKDLEAVARDLKGLTQKTEKIVRELKRLDKAQATKKPKAKAARKKPVKRGKRVTATNSVLRIIERRKRGIDTATLRKRTGYDTNKIRIILYRLKKRGKIKSEARGIYVKA